MMTLKTYNSVTFVWPLTTIAKQPNKNNVLSIKQPYFHLFQPKGVKDV